MPLYNAMNGVKLSFITARRALSSTRTSMFVIINIITNVDLIFLDTRNMVMDTSKEIVSVYPRILFNISANIVFVDEVVLGGQRDIIWHPGKFLVQNCFLRAELFIIL